MHQDNFENFQYTEDDYGFFPLTSFTSDGVTEPSIRTKNDSLRLGLNKVIDFSVVSSNVIIDVVNEDSIDNTTEEKVKLAPFARSRFRNAQSADETDYEFIDLEGNSINPNEFKKLCVKDRSKSPFLSEKRFKTLSIESLAFIYMILLALLVFIRNILFH